MLIDNKNKEIIEHENNYYFVDKILEKEPFVQGLQRSVSGWHPQGLLQRSVRERHPQPKQQKNINIRNYCIRKRLGYREDENGNGMCVEKHNMTKNAYEIYKKSCKNSPDLANCIVKEAAEAAEAAAVNADKRITIGGGKKKGRNKKLQ